MRAAALVLGLALLSGCSTTSVEDPVAEPAPTRAPVDPGSDHALLLRPADGGDATVSAGSLGPVAVQQLGSAPVTVTSSSLDRGRLRVGPGPAKGRAFRFPAYTEDDRYPRAVIVVRNASAQDNLDPGTADFSWGASFVVDEASEGRRDDDGNNLLQRGLFSQPTFFKAELDNDRAACSIRGMRGLVMLHSPYTVRPGVWHRVQCDRFGRYVRLRVWDLQTNQLMSTVAKSADIGSLSTPSPHPGIPLSVGGKVKPDGGIMAKASDQFNGSIASPFLTIDR